MLHRKGFTHSNTVISKALNDLQSFNRTLASILPSICVVSPPASNIRWIPPSKNIFKLNWDDAYDSNTDKIGLGVIVRDYTGNVVGTLRRPHPFLKNPHTTKAMAFLSVAQFG